MKKARNIDDNYCNMNINRKKMNILVQFAEDDFLKL